MAEQRVGEGSDVPQFELRHRLHRALEVADIKPETMAGQLGKSVTTIRNYLAGRTVPDRATLIVWAMLCGVDPAWLTGDEGEGGSPPDPTTGTRPGGGGASLDIIGVQGADNPRYVSPVAA
jgi:transcriptional regulator with XRE-family HTH domain